MAIKNTVFGLFISLAVIGQVAASDTLVIGGTGDSQEILRVLADRFNQLHSQTRVEIPDSVGSGGGIRGLVRGRFHLARTARMVKTREQTGSLIEHTFAYSPIVFATSPKSQQPDNLNLTKLQVNQVYSGEIKSWQALAGKDEPIYPIDREPGDSSRSVLEKKIEGFKDVKPVAKVFYNTPETVSAISEHKNSLGYLPMYLAIKNQLQIFDFEAVEVTNETVSQQHYPLVTTFYLVSDGIPRGNTRLFIDFLASEEARALISEYGLLPAAAKSR